MGEYSVDDLMWVVGSIDAYGAIHARAVSGGGNVMHGPAESKGKRWRWNIWRQEYVATRNASHEMLTDDEWKIVDDWLIKHGYRRPDDE